MRYSDEKKVVRITFLFSLLLHCSVLGVSGFDIHLDQEDERIEEVSIQLEIKKPPLLPKIDVMSEEKKITEVEPEEASPPKPEPPKEKEEIIKTKELVVDEIDASEVVVEEEAPEPIIEEKIEVPDPDKEAMLRYQDMVKQRIESCRRYPSWARKHEFEGASYVTFILLSNGMVRDIKLVHSSGFKILDKEAVSTVGRSIPFKPIPKEFKCSSMTMEVALVFQLE